MSRCSYREAALCLLPTDAHKRAHAIGLQSHGLMASQAGSDQSEGAAMPRPTGAKCRRPVSAGNAGNDTWRSRHFVLDDLHSGHACMYEIRWSCPRESSWILYSLRYACTTEERRNEQAGLTTTTTTTTTGGTRGGRAAAAIFWARVMRPWRMGAICTQHLCDGRFVFAIVHFVLIYPTPF